MKIVALTGGMGMGKSTAVAVFRRARVPVFDADATVHRLQAKGGRAVAPIAAAFPGTVVNGAVDRAALRHAALAAPDALQRLERIVHPLVREAEQRFLARARRQGARLVLLDIPLLFETGGDARADRVIVVSAPRAVQLARVRRRRQLSAAEAASLLARQMPDADKRRRADYVVHTGLSRYHSQRALRRLLERLNQGEPAPAHRLRSVSSARGSLRDSTQADTDLGELRR